MFRARILVLGCAAAMMVACSDSSIGPRHQPYDDVQTSSGSVQQLVGILEMVDETQFGVRQPNRLVALLCGCEELAIELGKEIRVWGHFNQGGQFAVTGYEIHGEEPEESDEPAALRVAPVRSKVMPRNGRLR
ncbi:MAG: hypothetical protein WD825_00660 [Gemmatimonadaceae bacterium]